jgi:hypothetical protein
MISHHGRQLVLKRAVRQPLLHRGFSAPTATVLRQSRFLGTPSNGRPAGATSLRLEPRYFSAVKQEGDDANDKQQRDDGEKESFQDMIHRMEKEGSKIKQEESSSSSSTENPQFNSFLRTAADKWSEFSKEVGNTWQELLQAGAPKDINKKLRHPEATTDGDSAYTGTVEIMVIDPSEHLTAWERMQRRLTEAPIIQGKNGLGVSFFFGGGGLRPERMNQEFFLLDAGTVAVATVGNRGPVQIDISPVRP